MKRQFLKTFLQHLERGFGVCQGDLGRLPQSGLCEVKKSFLCKSLFLLLFVSSYFFLITRLLGRRSRGAVSIRLLLSCCWRGSRGTC